MSRGEKVFADYLDSIIKDKESDKLSLVWQIAIGSLCTQNDIIEEYGDLDPEEVLRLL